MRDLLDAAVAEGLVSAPLVSGRVRVPLSDGRELSWPARPGGVLQASRSVDGPVLLDGVPVATPSAVLRLLAPDAPYVEAVARDLDTAVDHALDPPSGDLTENVGEVLAAVRGRPFHPTARAVSGWGADDLARWGPGHTVAVDAVAVRSDHLRLGSGGFPDLLDAPDGYRALPVHPFDREHVLPVAFAAEIADGIVVPLDRGAGEGRVTSSLRTLDLGGGRHLKLPLGVTTLGSARLLGARSLDFAQRGERVLRDVLAADPDLAARVAVADETAWAGFARPDGSDELDDRPGHLAAALRVLPPATGSRRMPLAALAASAWDGPLAALGDPEAVFGAVVDAVVEVGIGFLRHGVLPEMHGQNVLLDLNGRSTSLVLRDHDAVRVHPGRLTVAAPGYRFTPGGTQSLVLDTPEELIGFFATLAVEVGLGGVVDALVRHTGTPEPRWWATIRRAIEGAVARTADAGVRGTLQAVLLDADTWPYRTVLRPLLERGPSPGTSMPAGVTHVPNPLRT
ncbi:IucA/IucC family protein [Actinomycetospora chibensis]